MKKPSAIGSNSGSRKGRKAATKGVVSGKSRFRIMVKQNWKEGLSIWRLRRADRSRPRCTYGPDRSKKMEVKWFPAQQVIMTEGKGDDVAMVYDVRGVVIEQSGGCQESRRGVGLILRKRFQRRLYGEELLPGRVLEVVREETEYESIQYEDLEDLLRWRKTQVVIWLALLYQGKSVGGKKFCVCEGFGYLRARKSNPDDFKEIKYVGAAKYLLERGVERKDFNSYGSRRGNDEIMARGTFANIRIVNKFLKGEVGPKTVHIPTGETLSVFDAAMKYKENGHDTIILAGAEYGSGSSSDWAAKGPMLQGVKAVMSKSFERIHRSSLVRMGIVPLCFNSSRLEKMQIHWVGKISGQI